MNVSEPKGAQSEAAAPRATRRSAVREGRPNPLGATWNSLGVDFALFATHATKVELYLFDDKGQVELEQIELPEYTNEVWHGYLPDAGPNTIYGYRAQPLRTSPRLSVQSEQAELCIRSVPAGSAKPHQATLLPLIRYS
ncbi:hypothetical protein BB934_03330 [Microvirga ossetica]|uniref:Glycoside hydrolase family 13 N-terminal domain-containing protein n=1 Tax=Microvirga ossetica TaxID=1882682 RepID=A0A1B2EBL5_9HYPH|nr:hypothetical protein BB934_03330 [Microvirga ossetica]